MDASSSTRAQVGTKRPLNASYTDLARSTTARTSISDLSKARTWTSRSSLSVYHDHSNKLKWINAHDSSKDPSVTGILRPRFAKKEDSEIYSVKFSHDEDYIACGMGNAKIKLFSVRSNTLVSTLENPLQSKVPVTSVAFRPDNDSFKTKSVLAASYADGKIRHWHYTSGKLLSTIDEGSNEINSLTYSKNGLQFVTVGSDMHLRVYDAVTLKLGLLLESGLESITPGHSNRGFCAKFHPTNPKLLISGGWDNTLQIWDQRSGKSERSIYGPHICGDAIDINDAGDHILTGSYSKDNPLQIWDWSSGRLIDSIAWSGSETETYHSSLLYSASYSKGLESPAGPCHNRFIIAGGSNQNEMRIYTTESHRAVGSILGLSDAVYSVSMSPNDRYVALGGGGQALMVFNIEERSSE